MRSGIFAPTFFFLLALFLLLLLCLDSNLVVQRGCNTAATFELQCEVLPALARQLENGRFDGARTILQTCHFFTALLDRRCAVLVPQDVKQGLMVLEL